MLQSQVLLPLGHCLVVECVPPFASVHVHVTVVLFVPLDVVKCWFMITPSPLDAGATSICTFPPLENSNSVACITGSSEKVKGRYPVVDPTEKGLACGSRKIKSH